MWRLRRENYDRREYEINRDKRYVESSLKYKTTYTRQENGNRYEAR